MKPYGSNAKRKNYMINGGYWCNCYLCMPVKKNSKTLERQKAKKEIKKELDK
jgi:hypothetical protein